MHGFYYAKPGADWVQEATDTSLPIADPQYPFMTPMNVPIALAAAAGVVPDYYIGYAMFMNMLPQYKEGEAGSWIETPNLYELSTGTAVDLTAVLTAHVATRPDYTGGAALITDSVFQPFVATPPAYFWQNLVGCEQTA